MTARPHVPPVVHVRFGGRIERAMTHLEMSRRARFSAAWVLTWAPEAATSAERRFLVSLIRGRGVLRFEVIERMEVIKRRAGEFLEQVQAETGDCTRRTGQCPHAGR